MSDSFSRRFVVEDSSHIGEVRRAAQALAQQCEFTEIDATHAAIIASELATNVLKYARGGEVSIQWASWAGEGSLEILAVDTGPGMTDPGLYLRDGVSSGGTAGNGLGAVKRLSTEFDLFTRPDQGTVVLSRIARNTKQKASAKVMRCGVSSRPIKGETANGDSFRVADDGVHASFMVVDGLGHGPSAADAAASVTQVFDRQPFQDAAQMLENAHRAASGTRGAAVAVACVTWETAQISYAGVGNIAGSLLGVENGQGLMTHNGIVGAQMRKARSFSYSWPLGSILVMHSDGLQSRWNLDNYPGVRRSHPAIIAALLQRDFTRGRDDVTVLVATR